MVYNLMMVDWDETPIPKKAYIYEEVTDERCHKYYKYAIELNSIEELEELRKELDEKIIIEDYDGTPTILVYNYYIE